MLTKGASSLTNNLDIIVGIFKGVHTGLFSLYCHYLMVAHKGMEGT